MYYSPRAFQIAARWEFALHVAGQLKSFLRFYHNATGSLVLIVDTRYILPSNPLEDELTAKDRVIREMHHSIHPSRHLPEENVIHFKQITENGRGLDTRQYTKAIKSKSKIAPILVSILGNAANMGLISSKYQTFDLGTCDPGVFSPVFFVAVSHPSKVMSAHDDDFNIRQLVSGNYRIIILYCFIIKLPVAHTIGTHFITLDESKSIPEELKPVNALLRSGLNDAECVQSFKRMRQFLTDDFITKIRANIPDIDVSHPNWEEFIRLGGFFKKGRINTIEFNNFLVKAKARGLI